MELTIRTQSMVALTERVAMIDPRTLCMVDNTAISSPSAAVRKIKWQIFKHHLAEYSVTYIAVTCFVRHKNNGDEAIKSTIFAPPE